jgi:ATP-dependent Zn protease
MIVTDDELFSLKTDTNSKQETEKLFRMLEVKLGEERVAWQQSKSQIRVFRSASFVFLFLLIIGALAAFYFIFMRVQEQRSNGAGQTTFSDH